MSSRGHVGAFEERAVPAREKGAPKPTPAPSSSTAGFFQDLPHVPNQFYDDAALLRTMQFFLPPSVQTSITPDLARFGDLVLSREVLNWGADAEHNQPYLKTFDTFGRRVDDLVTSEGWRQLGRLAFVEGTVAIGFDDANAQYARMYQFLKIHLFSASSGLVTCPMAMQDGAATLLLRQLRNPATPAEQRPIFESAYRRLTSRDPAVAWTSGQWMTERPGGSDVRNTETRAYLDPSPCNISSIGLDGSPLGPWSVSGFKWFSSATDANMTILLAKTANTDRVSAFFAPLRRTVADAGAVAAQAGRSDELNGVQIQRLKNKLGTKSLPTAELVLDGMRAHLIGAEGQGTKEISTILNITRIYNVVTGVASWGRGLAVSRAFSRVRRTSGKLLIDMPAHMQGLAREHVDYRANMALAFLNVALLGTVDQSQRPKGSPTAPLTVLNQGPGAPVPADPATAAQLLRLFTPVAKALTALSAIAGLRYCMESLGGVGYLENENPELNIARLFRDTNVTAIWEGTSTVMAHDLVRVAKGSSSGAGKVSKTFAVADGWIGSVVERWRGIKGATGEWLQHGDFAQLLAVRWKALRTMVTVCTAEELQYRGQELLRMVGWAVCSVLLVEDALRDGDAVAAEIARRWVHGGGATGWGPQLSPVSAEVTRRGQPQDDMHFGVGSAWKTHAAWDRRIVFDGTHEVESGDASTASKL